MRDKPLDSLTTDTAEGIPVKPLYTAEDLAEWKDRIDHIRRFADSVYVVTTNDEGGRSVVNAVQISPDISQLLKEAPGANVNSNGPITGIPQYRGMYGPRIATSLDGNQLAGWRKRTSEAMTHFGIMKRQPAAKSCLPGRGLPAG